MHSFQLRVNWPDQNTTSDLPKQYWPDQYLKATKVIDVLSFMGELYLMAGDKSNAVAAYQRAIELDPANTNAKEMLNKAMQDR